MVRINKKIIIFMAFALAWLGALALTGASGSLESKRIIKGVKIMGTDLSGLDREMAEGRILLLEKEVIQSTPMVLKYGEKTWKIQPVKIGLAVDREKVLDLAFEVGRRGSFFERWKDWREARKGLQVPVYVKLDRVSLEKELDSIASEIASPPVDARLQVNPDETVEVVPSQEGIRVDSDRVFRDITELYAGDKPVKEVNLALVKSPPRKTTQEVASMGVDGLLAGFTTLFDANEADRAYNIKMAASALDGLIIPPGEPFSFNGAVGSRSSEAGYKNAKIIINNEFVEGPGGGVCQVSSTLYNAVLLANLEIMERSSHSLPVSYVPPGRDATVAENFLDFKFRNSTPSYLYMKTSYSTGKIAVKIYGNTKYRKQVTISTNVVETIPFKEVYDHDPSLEQGEIKLKRKGVPGLKVVAERLLVENGSVVVEKLPESHYRPVDQVVIYGPGVEPPGTGSMALPEEDP
ncbi:MAG: VanW family protein [Bacillota bacterium]